MNVDVPRMLEAVKKALWKHGFFAPERLTHEVLPDGRHRIELVLLPDEIEPYQSPVRTKGPSSLGPSAPDMKGRR